MARRNEKERLFCQWIEETLHKQPFLNKQHVLNGGAAVIDASPVTTARYLRKLTSPEGILVELWPKHTGPHFRLITYKGREDEAWKLWVKEFPNI